MARKIVQFQYDAVNDTFTVLCDDGTLRCRKFTLTEDARSASEVGRATSDLERRALEACESLYSDYKDSLADLTKSARNACAVGRESLAAKKPKGPWTQTPLIRTRPGTTMGDAFCSLAQTVCVTGPPAPPSSPSRTNGRPAVFDPPMEMPGSNELARAEHELATLRALYAEAVRALEGLAFFKGAAIPKSERPALLVAERKAAAALSRPEAQEVLRG